MLNAVESIKSQAAAELQRIVSKFKSKASSYFVDKLTIGMVSHLLLNGRGLGLSCSFRQLSNGGLELVLFDNADVKRALNVIRLARLGLCPELKSGNVYIPLPVITSSRRALVLKSLSSLLEQFKSSVRAVRRRALTALKSAKAVECDLKRVYLKRIEDCVLSALFELQQVYALNERRLNLS